MFPTVDPVDPEELSDYHEVIKHPIDLATMMCKIDAHEYQTVKEFLADVKLMSSNALEYNPSTYNEEQLIRHRACLVAGKCLLFNPYSKKLLRRCPRIHR